MVILGKKNEYKYKLIRGGLVVALGIVYFLVSYFYTYNYQKVLIPNVISYAFYFLVIVNSLMLPPNYIKFKQYSVDYEQWLEDTKRVRG